MSKPPCSHCRAKGAVFLPTLTQGWVQVVACPHCQKFSTDLEAARWFFKKPKVLQLDDLIQVVASEGDRI